VSPWRFSSPSCWDSGRVDVAGRIIGKFAVVGRSFFFTGRTNGDFKSPSHASRPSPLGLGSLRDLHCVGKIGGVDFDLS